MKQDDGIRRIEVRSCEGDEVLLRLEIFAPKSIGANYNNYAVVQAVGWCIDDQLPGVCSRLTWTMRNGKEEPIAIGKRHNRKGRRIRHMHSFDVQNPNWVQFVPRPVQYKGVNQESLTADMFVEP
jgi:hypothetical protein